MPQTRVSRFTLFSLPAPALLALGLAASFTPVATADVLLQSESRERFGEKDFAYFFIEAEDFDQNNPRGDGESWILSSEDDALAITANEFELDPETGDPIEADPDAFASGDESITNVYFDSTATNEVGGQHDVQYVLEFDTPGTYYLYIRQHSPIGPEINRNQNDSFYYPVEFGENPRQLKANGDDYGFLESIEFEGDVAQRGPWVWFAARQFVDSSEQNPLVEQNEDTFVEWEITEDMVGEELILEFDHRETGTMLDAFLFIATDSGIPPTSPPGPDGLGFFGPEDEVDREFGLPNLGVDPVEPMPEEDAFIRGDCNGDGATADLTDAVFLLGFNFSGTTSPPCRAACDLDGDGDIGSVTDAIAMLSFTFLGGPGPVGPFPACGPDPAGPEAGLGCTTPPAGCQ